jgi:hypothetical protein
MTFYSPTANVTSVNFTQYGWNIIGLAGDSVNNVMQRIFNRINATGTYQGNDKVLIPSTGARVSGEGEVFIRAVYAFSRVLTNSELDDIRINNILPSDDVIVLQFNNVDDYLYDEQIDGVARYRGWIGDGNIGWVDNGVTLIKPDRLWSTRDNHITGGYNLDYGFTRQGIYTIPYRTGKIKGSHSHDDDIEHLSTGCIHNMAESLLNFSSISDVTIKAIFDKSNRTYWKTSIESEDHYTDAGSGYYGLWHPTQLIRDFIDVHAQTGQENHIFTSLRTSTNTITGITSIRVYKTNLTD